MPRPIKDKDAKFRKVAIKMPTGLYVALLARAEENGRMIGKEVIWILKETLQWKEPAKSDKET